MSEKLRTNPNAPSAWAGGVGAAGIARICRNCDHYDGGGLDKNGEPREERGDCHNSISGRWQTTASDGCQKGFYPCSIRWPLRAGAGGKW